MLQAVRLPESRGPLYDGLFHAARPCRALELASPSTGEPLGQAEIAGSGDVDAAVRSVDAGRAMWRLACWNSATRTRRSPPPTPIWKVAAGMVNEMNFPGSGQPCRSPSRAFLHAGIHDAVLEKVRRLVLAIRLGMPIDPATRMGSLVSQAQYDKVMGYIPLRTRKGPWWWPVGRGPTILPWRKANL